MNTMYREERISIQGAVSIGATLTLPVGGEAPYPAILFLAGSGPMDRDSNSRMLKGNIFNQFAAHVAENGFVSLRYDKRGVGESGGVHEEEGLWDRVDDAETALRFLAQHPAVDANRIFVLGHSEGAVIAPALYQRHPVRGLILISGAAESIREGVEWQREQLMKEIEEASGFKGFLFRFLKVKNKIQKSNEEIERKLQETNDVVIRYKGKKLNAKWIREHYGYNALEEIKKVTCPVLAITGAKDVQVKPEHARILAEHAQGEGEWHIIEDLTHVLRKDKNPPSMLNLLKDYRSQSQQPIDVELLSIVDLWLGKYI
jgi:pimeloyl-ACP methyl ester carboxylesterase